jgi:hypothetical protein
MTVKWRGMIAPTEVPTGDGRMFAAGKMTHRPTPMPLMVRFGSGGHEGATVVGKVSRIFDGPGGYWAEGEFLDPAMVPEVPKAIYMLQEKVMGPSVDLDRDFTVEAIKHPLKPEKKAGIFKEYNVIGVTLVPMPAFHQVHMSVDNGEEKALLASIGVDVDSWTYFDINSESWKSWPIAPREYTFDADDAVQRIAAWAGIGSREPDLGRYASAFLWRNGSQVNDTLAQDSFRLPLADIINGQPYLIYHAVYSAAALLSGAHGGLPNIPDQEKLQMRPVIDEMYGVMAAEFNDANLVSPFQEGGGRSPGQDQPTTLAIDDDCGCDEGITIGDEVPAMEPVMTTTNTANTFTFNGDPVTNITVTFAPAPKEPYGDVEYADPGYREGRKRYPLDTEARVRAAISYLSMPKNYGEYSEDQLESMWAKIRKAAKKYDIEMADDTGKMSMGVEDQDQGALLAGAAPLAPPSTWFKDPTFTAPTKLTITDDGHVFGHLAQWRVCHVGIGRQCVMAPKSRTDYGLFRQGTVICDDGTQAPIGKITLGTGHADAQWGMVPSREHYDNTGWAAAVVNVGEDKHGIWINGALTTTMTPERVAELRASALSGDWREINGNLELIAALAVNNPGFPIYRMQNGNAFSLMAVGIVGQEDDNLGEFSMDEVNEETIETPEFSADDVAEEVDPELAARLERWEAIEEELEEHYQARRAAQLAAIDEERSLLS